MAGGVEDGIYTYDIPEADGGARVPDVEDLGGVEIQDNYPPPTKGAQRGADMDNVQTATLAGLCRMMPTCRLWVEFPAGVATVVAVDSMGSNISVSDFILDQGAGTGDLSIEWNTAILPPQNRPPRVWLTGDRGFAYATYAAGSIEVFTSDASPTAADLAFAVEIFG